MSKYQNQLSHSIWGGYMKSSGALIYSTLFFAKLYCLTFKMVEFSHLGTWRGYYISWYKEIIYQIVVFMEIETILQPLAVRGNYDYICTVLEGNLKWSACPIQ